jgi:hypothetical protein
MYTGKWCMKRIDRATGEIIERDFDLTFKEALQANKHNPHYEYKLEVPEYMVIFTRGADITTVYATQERLFHWYPELKQLHKNFNVTMLNITIGEDNNNAWIHNVDVSHNRTVALWMQQFIDENAKL